MQTWVLGLFSILLLAFAPAQAQFIPFGFLKAKQSLCPQNYIPVPPLSGYTTSTFCVAKYEAKQAGTLAVSVPQNTPWVGISRADAITACEAAGSKYKLITNDQWQSIARNIETQNVNWSGQTTVGDTTINFGNANATATGLLAASPNDDDACAGTGQTCSRSTWHASRRIHRLSNGEWIWDFAGNAAEYVRDDYSTSLGNAYVMFLSTSVAPLKSMFGPATDFSALPANNVPYGNLGSVNSSAGIGELSRGGSFAETATGTYGIFTTRGNSLSATSANRGFRCVYLP